MQEADLARIATDRSTSLFRPDIQQRADEIRDAVQGARVLVIGGAGSIGSATVRELVGFRPAALHVIDQNENELAELVRSLRSAPEPLAIDDFRTLPLDYGAVSAGAFLRAEAPWDLVLNFAAIKHVRSEKDSFSILQMFDTNIVKQARLLGWLRDLGFQGRYFSVSTDKAANPTSLMGASKRVMEHVMFDPGLVPGLDCTITSARFANVAFSNGSLLQSFVNRMRMGQPLAAPKDTRRYFVSLQESGQLCALAAVTGVDRHILIPRLDPETALIEMQLVAERFCQASGYRPVHYHDEDQACRSVARDRATGRWPLLLTGLDTSGEKPYEEFVADREQVVELGYQALMGVPWLAPDDVGTMPRLMAGMEALFARAANEPVDKDMLKGIIAMAEPDFLNRHRDTGRNLDQRV